MMKRLRFNGRTFLFLLNIPFKCRPPRQTEIRNRRDARIAARFSKSQLELLAARSTSFVLGAASVATRVCFIQNYRIGQLRHQFPTNTARAT